MLISKKPSKDLFRLLFYTLRGKYRTYKLQYLRTQIIDSHKSSPSSNKLQPEILFALSKHHRKGRRKFDIICHDVLQTNIWRKPICNKAHVTTPSLSTSSIDTRAGAAPPDIIVRFQLILMI